MKVTNSENLPFPIVEAIKSFTNYEYTPDKYSVTTLAKGTKEIILSRRYEKELEMDASDMIWSVVGNIGHGFLEKTEEEADEIHEQYFTLAIPHYRDEGFIPYGMAADFDDEVDRVLTLSGKMDLVNILSGKITDYKFTSVWQYAFGAKEEWKRQLGGYALILNGNGFESTEAENVVIYRDWSLPESLRSTNYPKKQCQVLTFDFTDDYLAETYNRLIAKLADILSYEDAPDDEIPPCNPEERWDRPTKWAAMKNSRKSAVKVFDSKEDADSFIASGAAEYLQERTGESVKCKMYCSCCQFCNFWKEKYQNANADGSQDLL